MRTRKHWRFIRRNVFDKARPLIFDRNDAPRGPVGGFSYLRGTRRAIAPNNTRRSTIVGCRPAKRAIGIEPQEWLIIEKTGNAMPVENKPHYRLYLLARVLSAA